MTIDPAQLLAALNQEYVALHTAKEDAFWTEKMGLTDDASKAREAFDEREVALQRFLQDPSRLEQVRAVVEDASGEDRVALAGWEQTLAANAIETAEGRALAEEIIAQEGALARSRGAMELGYQDPDQGFVRASSVKLGQMLTSEKRQDLRRAAWDGLRSIEAHVLDAGFLELVRQRNRLGRMHGAEDFYDWKVQRLEGSTKAEIFALLDELETLTADAGRAALAELQERIGGDVASWDVMHHVRGDVTTAKDPYFPFEEAVDRWGRSFAALGIRYRNASLRLDLLDRKGKYENGFMHGPEIAWREGSTFHRARVQFTANAIPGMVGSGSRATRTLFHEGGHAAHFANIDMPAPCFGQEFAPTSAAFAETQSMFLDSLLQDGDWQLRYALGPDGQTMPWELVEQGIRAAQPFAAWIARAMMAVCYGERAIYEIPDDELSAERVLSELREIERRLLGLKQGSHRPILSIPHLISGEASAYYHSYVLALMGVHQTRAFFLERDGYLVDNPKIGPDMRDAYWKPGNSRRCSELIEGLTGSPLGAAALAAHVNRTVDEALAQAQAARDRLESIPVFDGPVDLEADIEVVHGRECVASLGPDGFEGLASQFRDWIRSL